MPSAPFIPIPNTIQTATHWILDGQEVINDIYFQKAAGPVLPGDVAAITSAVYTQFQTSLTPLLSQDISLVRTHGRDLSAQFSFTADFGGILVPGAVAQGAEPNNVALCVSFRTGRAGRNGRGRNYVAGLPTGVVVGNRVAPAFITNVITFYQLFLSTLPGFNWVIANRRFNKLPLVTGTTVNVTTVLVTDNIVDSQRNRLPAHGK